MNKGKICALFFSTIGMALPETSIDAFVQPSVSERMVRFVEKTILSNVGCAFGNIRAESTLEGPIKICQARIRKKKRTIVITYNYEDTSNVSFFSTPLGWEKRSDRIHSVSPKRSNGDAFQHSRCDLRVAVMDWHAESPVKDNAPFVGRWSLNVADYPGFAEEGLTQGTITMELHEDGTGCTYYEGMMTSEYGYLFYMDYYVAVTADGEAESSLYALSDDGLTLTLTDIGGAWELAYQKEVA